MFTKTSFECLNGVAQLNTLNWTPSMRSMIDAIKTKIDNGKGPNSRELYTLVGAAFTEKFAELVSSGNTPTAALDLLKPMMDLWLDTVKQWTGE